RRVALAGELPLGLAAVDDPFAAVAPASAPFVTAGMFGTGFTLRLARAEAQSAGGSLSTDEEMLVLDLPALTEAGGSHSQGVGGGGQEAAVHAADGRSCLNVAYSTNARTVYARLPWDGLTT